MKHAALSALDLLEEMLEEWSRYTANTLEEEKILLECAGTALAR